MKEKSSEERQLIKMEEISLEKMSLEQKRQAERLYHQLGLDPVVNKVLKDFSNSLTGFDRVTDKVFGPYDIKGRADAIAKVTALMTYAALGEQYNKQVGNLESQIMTVEGERDKVRSNYDNLVKKVAEIVGGDYDELKTNYDELVERLAEVEHLRSQLAILNKEKAQLTERYESQIATLNKEKAQLTERYESQIATLKNEHNQEIEHLRSQITERDSKIEGLESEKISLTSELEQLTENYNQVTTTHEILIRDYNQLTTTHEALTGDYNQLKTAITTVAEAIPYEELRKKLGEELYTFLLKDSKVPDMVIDGVGKFIDFKKYLGIAVERGAKEACKRTREILEEHLR